MTGTAPTPESKCPTCGSTKNWDKHALVGMYDGTCNDPNHPVDTATDNLRTNPYEVGNGSLVSESKQEWCVTTAKRAFVNARAEQLDAEIVSESKPTSEGARALAEKLWLYSLNSVQAFVTIIPNPENHSSAIDEMAKSIENFAAPFRSQLAAAEKGPQECPKGHRVPHKSCKYCGMLSDFVGESRSRLIEIIFQWHDAYYRLERENLGERNKLVAAESEIQRLRERIAELEGSK